MASQTQTVAALAANIRAEMARRRIPQRAIAEALGIAQQGVSLRLNGRVPIHVNELYTIADVIGVPVTSLLPTEQEVA